MDGVVERRIRAINNEMLCLNGRNVIVKTDPSRTDTGFLVYAIVLTPADEPMDRFSIGDRDWVVLASDKRLVERVSAWIADHIRDDIIEPPYRALREAVRSEGGQDSLPIAQDLRTSTDTAWLWQGLEATL